MYSFYIIYFPSPQSSPTFSNPNTLKYGDFQVMFALKASFAGSNNILMKVRGGNQAKTFSFSPCNNKQEEKHSCFKLFKRNTFPEIKDGRKCKALYIITLHFPDGL